MQIVIAVLYCHINSITIVIMIVVLTTNPDGSKIYIQQRRNLWGGVLPMTYLIYTRRVLGVEYFCWVSCCAQRPNGSGFSMNAS